MPEPDLDGQKRPFVVAHRGASATHPENTLSSFQAAVAAGADLVEMDARLSADGVVVIMHDADVSTTTDGTGFVHTRTVSELKRMDASGGTGPRAEIPTLGEALGLLSGRAGVNVEIKNIPGEPGFDPSRQGVVDAVLAILERGAFRGRVLLSSFNWLSMERVRELAPHLPTGLLSTSMADPTATLACARAGGHTHVLPHASAVVAAGEAFVRRAHEQGVQVGTWTVDEPELIEEMFALGVDAVATNRPEVAVPIRDRFRQHARGLPG